ncbi:uncharacterized protein BDR25DRAFT_370412 [Lindgomyces ingoldianus]|uniref:Uncharacterized protein n=1 Tax=Lindgomyces ingoldianus TaxID=673940 RepID=A0ACB6QSA2_9PLEO|nr:uncharacterized protein BDR25DRAFT_370412 [Lindgomyces ingoldianus]KAF2469781.1 hypothetical protein BDR25DRAFT_370412 [Lindgomyces ingoldianus]
MFSTTSTSTPKYGWEDGPMQLISTPFSKTGATDQYTFVASEMALVHNCIARAFNSIYKQAPYVQPADYSSFISYSYSCYQGLEVHHHGEETYLFPAIEEATGIKGLMDGNVKQHEAFHSGFHAWGEWLKALNSGTGTEKFSGEKCVQLMDVFLVPLSIHLVDEIPSLLSLSQFGDSLDLKALTQKEADKVMGSMSKTTQLPAFLLNHDVTFEGGVHHFPPIPTPVGWVLRNVFGRVKGDWWRFAACGFDGRPRGLFVGA